MTVCAFLGLTDERRCDSQSRKIKTECLILTKYNFGSRYCNWVQHAQTSHMPANSTHVDTEKQ